MSAVANNQRQASMQRVPRAHACFLLEAGHDLYLPDGVSAYELWRNLSHRLMRQPEDLRAQTQRVLLCQRHVALYSRLPGALHDLFFVLGASGLALRQRLLAASMSVLDDESALLLGRWLAGSLPGGPPVGTFNGSVLPSMAHLQKAAAAASAA
jgi:hypothetical protein